jgi:asparagine synthase (glutamine-hydrolysing)
VWVSFNGEIYNFAELRRQLEARGHLFRSRTDTEVLVHGWEEWGEGLLERIEGMFAFALHDRDRGLTVLARDRLGIKPLYYAYRPDGALVAASEVKALLAAGVDARLDLEALDRFLAWLWVPEPGTAFAGVRQLPPGHMLMAGPDMRCSVRQYWDFALEPETLPARERAARLRDAVDAAVRRQLESDVPLGAFFSGGIDSTAIVELMRRDVAPALPTCFTVGFAERDLAHERVVDDLTYTRLYESERAIDYREIMLTPDLPRVLPEVVWHLDDPIADPAALSAYRICEAAKGELTVMLSGMGGDELFGGYPRYVATELARRVHAVPKPLRAALSRMAAAIPAAGTNRLVRVGRRAQALLAGAAEPFPGSYLRLLSYYDAAMRQDLYAPDLALALADADAAAIHREHLAAVDGAHWLDQAMYLDLKTFLASHNLTYMDKTSMAHSIEVRVPLLDELVVDVMRRTPPEDKLAGLRTKPLFKEAMRGIVPDAIIDRRKAGFGAPLRGWLSNELAPLVDDLLSPAAVRQRGLFRPEAVQRLTADFRSGRRDTAYQIWQLLTLELWQETFLDRGPRRASAALAAVG